MAAFLVRQNLSRGDLRLCLSNQYGYAQDAFSVRWTVYTADGTQISGKSLKAIRAACGEYYAPWSTDVANGNYQIVWEIQSDSGGSVVHRTENLFVVDPSSYSIQFPIGEVAYPVAGLGTFLTGQMLGRGDLPLFLKDDNGYPQDAYAVFWSILDVGHHCVVPRTAANHATFGEYYASWQVALPSGNYTVLWEFQQDTNSPMQSAKQGFSVILPALPFAVVLPGECPGQPAFECVAITPFVVIPRMLVPICEPYPEKCGGTIVVNCPSATSFVPNVPVPSGACCGYEIPRAIHLPTGFLPPAGGYTSQAYYVIPQRVRNITFYVTYSRGVPGGYTSLRLMWGNGMEETQETLIDTDITINNQYSAQSMFLQELDGPVPPDNNPVSFMIEARVPGGATTVRLIAAEAGVPGAPGTIGITLTAATT